MATRKGRPGEGPRRSAEQFSHTRTERGEKAWTGWIACEPAWKLCHTSKAGSKPCLDWISFGRLPCSRCNPLSVPAMIAYVFLWRESDLHPAFVICREATADLLEELAYGVYVQVSLGNEDTATVCVRRCVSQKPFRTKHPLRREAIDPDTTLLTVWKIPELTEYITCNSDNVLSLPTSKPNTVRSRGDGKPFSPMSQGAANKYALPEASAEQTADYAETVNRLKRKATSLEPSKNGKHSPTDET